MSNSTDVLFLLILYQLFLAFILTGLFHILETISWVWFFRHLYFIFPSCALVFLSNLWDTSVSIVRMDHRLLSVHLLKYISVASRFWQICINLQVSVWTTFYSSLGKYQGVWLLDAVVRVCLALQETTKLSSNMALILCTPTSNDYESMSCLPPPVPMFCHKGNDNICRAPCCVLLPSVPPLCQHCGFSHCRFRRIFVCGNVGHSKYVLQNLLLFQLFSILTKLLEAACLFQKCIGLLIGIELKP